MDVEIVNKDTIDLLVSAAVIGNSMTARDEKAQEVVRAADRIGQRLWGENHAAFNAQHGTHRPTPRYLWQPLFDLMWQPEPRETFTITAEQALQVERCRLFLVAHTAASPEWGDSFARAFLERLGAAIANRLQSWPIVVSEDHAGSIEYSGLSALSEQWQRPVIPGVEPRSTRTFGG